MKSIQRHLTLWLLAALGVTLLVGGVVTYWAVQTALLREFDGKLLAQANRLAAYTEHGPEDIEFKFPASPSGSEDAASLPTYFCLWLSDGSILVKSPDANSEVLRPSGPNRTHLGFWDLNPQGLPALRAVSLTFQPLRPGHPRKPPPPAPKGAPPPPPAAEAREAALPDEPKGGSLARPLTLVVAEDRSHLEATLGRLRGLLAVAGLSALLTGVITMGWVLRRSLAPLSRMGEQAAALDATTLHRRFAVDGMPLELIPMAERWNQLLERLTVSFERERRFSADLAHEFRTPLAELRTLAELELSRPDGTRAEVFREVLEITGQMELLASRILALARAEQGQLTLASQEITAAEFGKECIGRYKEMAAGRSLQLMLSMPPAASTWRITTDLALLRSVLGNLLENAVLYSPEGGTITVTAAVVQQTLSLTVRNPAPELKAADLPHLTERFWRKDAARTESVHFGLGLPLAQVLAQALGGRLVFELDGNGCFSASLCGLPLKESPGSPLQTPDFPEGSAGCFNPE